MSRPTEPLQSTATPSTALPSARALAIACLCSASVSSAAAFELTVVSYNVESDADTAVEQVSRDIARIPPSHLWALSEVHPRDFEAYRAAIGRDHAIVQGTTGRSDRLAIVYDPRFLSPVGQPVELSAAGGSRHPLQARFRIAGTRHEMFVVANHLQRGNAETRQAQARWLNRWAAGLAAAESPPPILLLGAFNFDVDPQTRAGNRAYDLFRAGDAFRWIRPACVDRGTCPATGTGCNPRYTSILDFHFLAGGAADWPASAEILFRDDAAYCDREAAGGSDHRPVRAVIAVPGPHEP